MIKRIKEKRNKKLSQNFLTIIYVVVIEKNQ